MTGKSVKAWAVKLTEGKRFHDYYSFHKSKVEAEFANQGFRQGDRLPVVRVTITEIKRKRK